MGMFIARTPIGGGPENDRFVNPRHECRVEWKMPDNELNVKTGWVKCLARQFVNGFDGSGLDPLSTPMLNLTLQSSARRSS